MPISAQHIGRSYLTKAPYQVCKTKIAEFAAALGDNNPVYFTASPIAPPTFAAVIAAQGWEQLFADPELDLALHRVVHVQQGFEYNRMLKAGDEVMTKLQIKDVKSRGNTDWITVS
ncbi:MAG: hypothetical protein CR979_03995, partial [Propionibacterium sp.]